MVGRFLQGDVRVISFPVRAAAGDLVIFDAGVAADAGLMQVRFDIIVIEIEADVAIELTVDVIAGIAFDGAPNLLRRLGVAPHAGDAALGTHDRRIHAVLRPRLREQDAVGIDEEVADAALFENFIDAGDIAALGQPHALRAFAEMPLELAATDLDLGAHGVGVVGHERQEAVRRAARDELEPAGLEESAKAVIEVIVVLPDENIARPQEAVMIHVGEMVELALPLGPFDFLAGEGDQVVEVAKIAHLQKRIGEHGGQGRRDRHGEPPISPVALEAFHHFQDRDVGLGNGFVEPIFFQEIVVLGMADVGQMGVQHQAEVTERHCAFFASREVVFV